MIDNSDIKKQMPNHDFSNIISRNKCLIMISKHYLKKQVYNHDW
jgi:hypothetical protein